MCFSIIFGVRIRMQRGRLVKRGGGGEGGSSFRTLLLSTVLSSSHLATLCFHTRVSHAGSLSSGGAQCGMLSTLRELHRIQTLSTLASHLSFVPAWRYAEKNASFHPYAELNVFSVVLVYLTVLG